MTPRNYGFCDAAEIFMFISGVTCALAYGRAREREGWSGMIGRSLRRGWTSMRRFYCSRSLAPSSSTLRQQ
ncbi:OpgC domain-containing protein [Bradyrhizobium japonicum]